MAAQRKYPDELRERAVKMVLEIRELDGKGHGEISRVARQLKAMRNLQEGRHGLGRHLFHGRKGELHRAYHAGMEDQLGALGLVLNCVTLWNTLYLDHALSALRAQGYPVTDADAAHLSAYQYRHINVHGHYSFALPDLGGNHRPLRDPDAPGED